MTSLVTCQNSRREEQLLKLDSRLVTHLIAGAAVMIVSGGGRAHLFTEIDQQTAS